jgi:hypothetical protein
MEVHHHPHVGKKNFKEYLLEGLMIFLAVSMGFIAENIRENIVEHEIEKRNIELIVDNLKEDTTTLRNIIINKTKALVIIDSLILFRDKNLKDSNNYKTFFNLFDRAGTISWFRSNQSGLDQMKSSGSLRYVKKKQVLDSLYRYEKTSKSIERNGEYDLVLINRAEEVAGHFMVYDYIKPRSFNIEQQSDALNRFYNDYFYVYGNYKAFYIPQMQKQLDRGKRLIKLLQEEYSIEE